MQTLQVVAATAVLIVGGLLIWRGAYLLRPGWKLEVRMRNRPVLVLDKPNFYWVYPFASIRRVRIEEPNRPLTGGP